MLKIFCRKSDNKAVKVSSKGKVTIQGTGCAVITIKAAGTSNYNEENVKVTVLVSPKKQTLQAPKALAGRKLKISWKKDTKAAGYEVQYSTDKNFKNKKATKTKVVKSNKTISVTIGKLAKGKKYHVRVRAYKTAKAAGKNQKLYGKWSSTKRSGKIKK